MSRIVYVNERHILEAEFSNLDRELVNVAEGIVVYIITPEQETLLGPFSATRTETGIYRYDYYPPERGEYHYRFQTPTGTIISEDTFNVKRSIFPSLPPFPAVVGAGTSAETAYVGVDGGKLFGVLDVPSYTYVGVDGSANVVEIGVTPSYTYSALDGQLGFHPMIFMIGSDESFYTMDGVFSTEVDTGLDLTGLDIISMDRNQVDGRIWALGSDGRVHSWSDDGTDLQFEFDTTYGDLEDIAVDNKNQRISVSTHTAATFNERTYWFSFAGAALFNYENRSGSSSLNETFRLDGDYGFIVDSNSSIFSIYRQSMATGTVEFIQRFTALEAAAAAVDYPNRRAWQWGGGGFWEFDLDPVPNPDIEADFLGTTSIPRGSAAKADYFEWYDGNEYVVGCGDKAGPNALWSFEVGGATSTNNRTSVNMKAICTRRRYES